MGDIAKKWLTHSSPQKNIQIKQKEKKISTNCPVETENFLIRSGRNGIYAGIITLYNSSPLQTL
jgi:hypothetical protein